MIEIVPISDDDGFAVCLGDLRVDVYPPNEIDTEAFVSITEPRMSLDNVRKFAMLLLAAVEFAEGEGGLTPVAADWAYCPHCKEALITENYCLHCERDVTPNR